MKGDNTVDTQALTLPTHPLVRQLWQIIEHKRIAGQSTSQEVLDLFWDEVAAEGTPLLHDVDGTTRATLLYREEIEHMIDAHRAYYRVEAAFDTTCFSLSLLPRSNVWWAEFDLPKDFTGMYCFERWDHEGLIREDIHEPWAMSFVDEYNDWHTQESDSAYARHIASTKEQIGVVREGTVSELQVSAEQLEVPERVGRTRDGRRREPDPVTYPVWTYEPREHYGTKGDQRLPLVLLMAGQFHESMSLSGQLDAAIETGVVPPVAVCSPGYFREGYTAWGWRNGYGPRHDLEFLDETLVPYVSRHLNTEERVHLMAWSWTTQRTIATALRVPERVASLIFVAPKFSDGWPGHYGYVDRAEAYVRHLADRVPNVPIAVGLPPERGESEFSWKATDSTRFVDLATQAGLDVRTFEVSDPNIVAQGEAIPAGISAVMGRTHR